MQPIRRRFVRVTLSLALALCLAPIAFGFVLPVAFMLRPLVQGWGELPWAPFAGWALNSLWLAGLSAALATVLAVLPAAGAQVWSFTTGAAGDTTPPTITLSAAINGGTTATATCTLNAAGGIKALGGGKFDVSGKLSIKGASRDITVDRKSVV